MPTAAAFQSTTLNQTVIPVQRGQDSPPPPVANASELASGTYTPTLTIYNNIDAVVPHECQYLRVGNTVHVSGRVDVDATAMSTLTVLGLTLPIPSALTLAEHCAGTGATSGVFGQGSAIFYDTSLSAVTLRYISGDTTLRGVFFTFTYRVV